MESWNLEKRRRVMQRSIQLGHCICDPKLACPCDLLREQDVCLCAGERLEMPTGPVRLTQLVEKTGCSSKIDQATLHRVLGDVAMPADPRVIIGAPAGDDAGVFRIGDTGPAWVQTVDVFSPCVDDPYLFGQIAAANSVSDIYAMGGTPLTALSIIGFPARELPDAIMRDILRGGVDKMAEAGVAIIGGHSINDREIKAGFAVTGLVDPDRIMSNAGARPGDVLVLTKPIGTGILSFAGQIDRAPAGSLDAIGRSMASLNKAAAEIMRQFDVHACTDVTGFGLIGHLSAMAAASGVDVQIVWDDVPFFDGVLQCAAAGIIPGGIERNRESSQTAVTAGEDVSPLMLDVLFDPQTSGGLLIAVAESDAPRLIDTLVSEAFFRAGLSSSPSSPRRISPLADLRVEDCEPGARRRPDGLLEKQRILLKPAAIGRVTQAGTGRIHVRTSGRVHIPQALTDTPQPRSHRNEESTMSDCCSGGHNATPAESAGTGGVAETQKKFQEFLHVVNRPGALDAHTKQAICLALAVLAKCEPCVRSHIGKAREKGFSAEEIDEAAWLAISFGGAPLMMFYNEIRKQVL